MHILTKIVVLVPVPYARTPRRYYRSQFSSFVTLHKYAFLYVATVFTIPHSIELLSEKLWSRRQLSAQQNIS